MSESGERGTCPETPWAGKLAKWPGVKAPEGWQSAEGAVRPAWIHSSWLVRASGPLTSCGRDAGCISRCGPESDRKGEAPWTGNLMQPRVGLWGHFPGVMGVERKAQWLPGGGRWLSCITNTHSSPPKRAGSPASLISDFSRQT